MHISEKMHRQIRGLTQVSYNTQDGISLIQTAEDTLNEILLFRPDGASKNRFHTPEPNIIISDAADNSHDTAFANYRCRYTPDGRLYGHGYLASAYIEYLANGGTGLRKI